MKEINKNERISLEKNKICPKCGASIEVKDLIKDDCYYKHYKCNNCGFETEKLQMGFI